MFKALKILGIFVVLIFSLSLFEYIKDNFDELNQKNEKLTEEIQNITKVNEKLIERERNLSEKFVNLSERLEILEKENEELKNNLEREKLLNRELTKSIERIRKQNGLINPTYKQLKDFVLRDDTEMFESSKNFDCTEFSNNFIKRFAKKGFYSCTTELTFNDDTGHIIVAVNTIDEGIYYIEPQTDRIFARNELRVGINYCSLVDWDCYLEIKKISSCFELKI